MAPPWGGGGNLTGGSPPQGGVQGLTLDSQPSLPLRHLSLPCVLGRAQRQTESLTTASLPLLPPRPFSQQGTVGSHPAPKPSWGHDSPPYAGHLPRGPPAPPRAACGQTGHPGLSPRGCPLEEALGRLGAAGGRGEVTPWSRAAGLCLCAHFGNCRFSSLANYLLGGGLKTVHTHKSPRDLNKRRWQVIFQHSPTLTHRERGRVGPPVGCGENELRQAQGPATRHPGRLMEGWAA